MKKLFVLFVFTCFVSITFGEQRSLSPTRIITHPVTGEAYVLLSTALAYAKVDLKSNTLLETVTLGFNASDIAFSPDGETLFVTEYEAEGKLHLFSVKNRKKLKTISVGAYPASVCVHNDGSYAWVTNRFSNDLSVIDLHKKKEEARIPMIREPRSLRLSPDGKILAVANFLPLQSALDNEISAQVTLLDVENRRVIKHIALKDGSQSIGDVCFSKDGNQLFVSHILSRYAFPTTQLERGWMNTNALSIIDVPAKTYLTTLLLDDMYKGAANPCGMNLSEKGDVLYIAVSGTHEVIALSLPLLVQKMKTASLATIGNDLTFLNEIKTRIPLQGKGARQVIDRNGKLFTTDYFSGGLTLVDKSTGKAQFITLGNEPEPDEARKGELYFADAELCFQSWQSCISCHPEARADGLNWDLVNDGLGNPKNSKSMLYAHVTPPCMITGIRANAEIAVRAGIKHIQFVDRPEQDAVCIDKYLTSIIPLQSPYLKKGKLSKAARKGEKIFGESGCLDCHNGAYYTDGNKYNVGTGIEEYTHVPFDTPTLKEVWRTAPYLYNGAAKTIKEVLTGFNKGDKHGITSHLTEEDIDALEEYILSL